MDGPSACAWYKSSQWFIKEEDDGEEEKSKKDRNETKQEMEGGPGVPGREEGVDISIHCIHVWNYQKIKLYYLPKFFKL